MAEKITVQATIQAPVEKVWECYTQPKHITQWNAASDDWHSPKADNDLRVGGKFVYRMESRDKSKGFDFEGTYTEVKEHELIAYTIIGGREVRVMFESHNDETKVTVEFEAENENSLEMQRQGWQSILNNFKTYTETPS